ncbi:hypothetical protein MASR2M48_26180 [Spirochaetota bacterium]
MNHNMDTSLNLEAKALASMLSELGLSLSCAESCTGGMAAATITDGAGASRFFYGGIVAYSNTIKERILGVSADILLRHGAVSEETALDMARGRPALWKRLCVCHHRHSGILTALLQTNRSVPCGLPIP